MFAQARKSLSRKKGEGENETEHEESLTTILVTHEDRTNLLLLIADCTETMRAVITNAFDPEKVGNESNKVLIGDKKPTGSSQKPLNNEGRKETTEGVETAEEIAEREREEHDRRVRELSAPKTQELRQAAIDYFDEWRDRVIQRIGEVINSPADGSKEPEKHESGSENTHHDEPALERPTPEDGGKADSTLPSVYEPHATPLSTLPEAQRILIVHSVLLLLLSLEAYPSQSRVLLLHIITSLKIPLSVLIGDETKVAQGLLEAAKQMSADEETKKRADSNVLARRWKTGLGIVAGAALIGITGGLAAPLLAAGIGTVMGGIGLGGTAAAAYLGALAGSAPLVGALFGAYGGKMTGEMVDQYAKEVSDFAFVPLKKSYFSMPGKDGREARRLRVAIGITGWLTEQGDITKPWAVLSTHAIEPFALRWELECLVRLGNALTTYAKSAAWNLARTQIIKHTVFAALSAGLWPIGLANASRLIDNPFSVARSRSEKAGEVLADALVNKVQGERPVTLIGYSLGARVIFSCLLQLADRHAFGLVENVVIVGGPLPSDSIAWRKMRTVVSGRLINAYSSNDYLLAYLYRTSSLQLGIAGLQAIENVAGIENVDVSNIIEGHTKYQFLTGTILQKIGFEDIDMEEVKNLERALVKEEVKEKEEEAKREQEGANKEENMEDLEKEVERKNEEGMMGWMSRKMSGFKLDFMGDRSEKEGKGKRENSTTEKSENKTKEQSSGEAVERSSKDLDEPVKIKSYSYGSDYIHMD